MAESGGLALTRALVASLRPKQFVKNLLIFAPAIFTGPAAHGAPHRWLLSPGVLPALLVTFTLLSLMVGCTYIINDYIDLESDKHNPARKKRPMAAGEIQPRLALGFALAVIPLVLVAVAVWQWHVALSFAIYLVATLLYSLVLKRIVIVDIMTIAGLFVLRAYVGSLVVPAPLSMWFVSCVGSLALFIAICKRHHELHLISGGDLELDRARSVIRDYNRELVLMIMSVSAMGALLTYTFFSLYEGPRNFGVSIPFVVFGLFRFLYLVLVRGVDGTPEATLLKDPPLLITVVAWIGLLLYIYSAR